MRWASFVCTALCTSTMHLAGPLAAGAPNQPAHDSRACIVLAAASPPQELMHSVRYGDVAARLQAANVLAEETSAHGVMLLYILASDVDDNVQAAALGATLRRCTHESALVCASMMQFFVGEQDDAEIHWQARDWLLLEQPAAATRGATASYKCDVVARLSEQIEQPGVKAAVLRVLRLLAEDPDLEVQEAAAAALLRARL